MLRTLLLSVAAVLPLLGGGFHQATNVAASGSSGTTISVSISVGQADTLVVVSCHCRSNSGSTATVSDSGGSYTRLGGITNFTSQPYPTTDLFWVFRGSGSRTPECTFADTCAARTIIVNQYTLVHAIGTVNDWNVNTGTSSSSSGNFTTNIRNVLLVGAASTDETGSGSVSAGSDMTLRGSHTDGSTGVVAGQVSRVVAATGTYATFINFTFGARWAHIGMGLKDAVQRRSSHIVAFSRPFLEEQ